MTVVPREEYLAALETFRASAALVVRDEAGRVLMLRTTYRPATHEVPGGAVEPGESPRAAAAREALEETGLALVPGRLLCVDYAAARPDNPSAMLHFVFDGGVLTPAEAGRIVLDPAEVTAYEWVPPADVARLAGPRLGRRLAAALRGTGAYCEEGAAP